MSTPERKIYVRSNESDKAEMGGDSIQQPAIGPVEGGLIHAAHFSCRSCMSTLLPGVIRLKKAATRKDAAALRG